MAAKKKSKELGVAERMMSLFDGYKNASGTHGMPNLDPNGVKWSIKKTAKTVNIAVTAQVWEQHLSGTRPLGIVPIRTDSTCVWGCIDVDKYNIDLLEVVKRVESLKLPLVPCKSKSGGLHLFMFAKESMEASVMQITLRNLAATLGFADSEIFPKQTQILVDQGDSGSWMVMPYYGDTFGGKLKFQRGLKKTGAEMTVEEFLSLAEKSRVTESDVALLRQRSIPEDQGGKRSREKSAFGDGPPCLQFLAETGFPEGGRNNALMHLGIYLKKAFPTNWRDKLEEDNHKYMRPPLPSDEVEQVKKSLEKKDYEYMCKQSPMVSHCDSIMCRTRKYGVGNEMYPQITAMRKIMTDPPTWFLDIEGSNGTVTLRMPAREMYTYKMFQCHCIDVATMMFKHINDAMWTAILQEAMMKTEIIDAPPDLGAGGRFRELMETFCTNRQRGLKKEDLLRGVPWEDEEKGRYYFKLADLQKFLDRENMKMSRGEVTFNVKRMHNTYDKNGKIVGNDLTNDIKFTPHVGMRVKESFINTWWIPSSAIQRQPELDVPDMPKEKI